MKKVVSIFLMIIAIQGTAQESNSMLENGLSFLGIPYVAGTLEVGEEEALVVNREQVDCTTFVEYVLAMSLCSSQRDEMQEEEFKKNLLLIRYRDGKIDGYTSRLHYMSDWINDNVRKGIIEDITARNSSSTLTLSLSFMSTHPELYKQLAGSPVNVAKMTAYEKALSNQTVYWIPKEKIPAKGFSWIKNGDIIAVTTPVPGLDITHIGIAVYMKDELHLLHASSLKRKVIIGEIPLNEQLGKDKNMSGIRVLRMKR